MYNINIRTNVLTTNSENAMNRFLMLIIFVVCLAELSGCVGARYYDSGPYFYPSGGLFIFGGGGHHHHGWHHH